MDRRGGERYSEVAFFAETSEYGERLRPRPLDGDLEAIVEVVVGFLKCSSWQSRL